LESASPDVLRAMAKTSADALMPAEADALCGAGATQFQILARQHVDEAGRAHS